MKKILTYLLLCVSTCVYAQTHNLSDEELDAFKIQCQERIDAFQMGLEIIADKKQDSSVRQHYINTIPELFMGEGKPWKDLKGEQHPAVKMQVAIIRYNEVVETKESSLVDYLNNLRNLRWKTVKITKAKTCRISNFYQVSDRSYEATATFFQYFEGNNGEGGQIYKDFTQKEVKIYISQIEDGQLGAYWDMKFGDINVSEISRL